MEYKNEINGIPTKRAGNRLFYLFIVISKVNGLLIYDFIDKFVNFECVIKLVV